MKTKIGIGILLCMSLCLTAEVRMISENDLRDKITGFWYGQLVGNYIGFPFENVYIDEPIDRLIDRYYHFDDQESYGLTMNDNDRRAYTHIMADAVGGAWSDDDTDIELVTLHAVETYGLDLNYEEITMMWKRHINRFIWGANREARDLMDKGVFPPHTGSVENNEYWYRISSQLVNEIWSAFYPGMMTKALQRAEWGASIMCDSWATHVTQVYAVMYSAAFFENDVFKLVELARDSIPEGSPFFDGINDVIKWHEENSDWRETRESIHDKYFEKIGDFEIPRDGRYLSSFVNGLCGIMALLYGEGEFVKTVAIATSAGYDCDNQAATCGGLIGILAGGSRIPEHFTKELPSRGSWEKPFNNLYINYSRDALPNVYTMDEIIERILEIADSAILEEGGSRSLENGEIVYKINCDF